MLKIILSKIHYCVVKLKDCTLKLLDWAIKIQVKTTDKIKEYNGIIL